MLSRKKRDAKFLIFQSLYIIAIAILFYKGTDLSLTKVIPYNESDTVIAKINLPSTDLGVYDPKLQEVLPILPSDSEYVKVLKGEILISKDELDKKNARIAELERMKTPIRGTSNPPVTVDEDKTPQNPVKGGRSKDNK